MDRVIIAHEHSFYSTVFYFSTVLGSLSVDSQALGERRKQVTVNKGSILPPTPHFNPMGKPIFLPLKFDFPAYSKQTL